MRKLTERQYKGFATLNSRMVKAIEQNGIGPFEDVDSLEREWEERETGMGKKCNKLAVSIAGYNYLRYFDALADLKYPLKPYCYTVITRWGEEITGTIRATDDTRAAYDVWKIHGDAEKIDVLPTN